MLFLLKKIIKSLLRKLKIEIFNLDLISNEKFNIQKFENSKFIRILNNFCKILKLKNIFLKISPNDAQKIQPYIYEKNPIAKNNYIDKEKCEFVIIAGLGSSGSSAVIDYFLEYNNFHEARSRAHHSEFRLIKDPGGLADLYSSVIKNNYWNSGWHVQNFLNQVEIYNRKMNDLFSFMYKTEPKQRFGMNFSEITNNQFITITHDFLSKIFSSKVSYPWWNELLNFDFFDELKYQILFKFKNKKNYFYFHDKKKNEISLIFQTYLEKIFNEIIKYKVDEKNWHLDFKESRNYLILNQGLGHNNVDDLIEIMPTKTKMIIVVRDPRDMYISNLKLSYFPKDIKTFCDFYRNEMHKIKSIKSKKVLIISFEEWIINHEKLELEVSKFLNFDLKSRRDYKGLYFNLKISNTRISKWKKNNNEKIIEDCKLIKEELFEYCSNY